ncbi:MAG: hypothetical protein HQL22_01835 [Candidatus Omnitrophica bacterium]|nr:hypothetical protein [Candidatus Omnitrophota bacterium]
MADKFFTAFMGGISDGFTPPYLAVMALSGLMVLLTLDAKVLFQWVFGGFIVGHLCTGLVLRLGLFNDVISGLWYFRTAAIFYMVIATVLIATGCRLAFGWYRFYRSAPFERLFPRMGVSDRLPPPVVMFIGGTLLGALMAFAGFSCPVNVAVLLLSNEIYMPGLIWSTVWSLFVYEAALVLLLAVSAGTALYCLSGNRSFFVKKRSLMLSVLAAVYTALGAGVFVIFIQQLF